MGERMMALPDAMGRSPLPHRVMLRVNDGCSCATVYTSLRSALNWPVSPCPNNLHGLSESDMRASMGPRRSKRVTFVYPAFCLAIMSGV